MASSVLCRNARVIPSPQARNFDVRKSTASHDDIPRPLHWHGANATAKPAVAGYTHSMCGSSRPRTVCDDA